MVSLGRPNFLDNTIGDLTEIQGLVGRREIQQSQDITEIFHEAIAQAISDETRDYNFLKKIFAWFSRVFKIGMIGKFIKEAEKIEKECQRILTQSQIPNQSSANNSASKPQAINVGKKIGPIALRVMTYNIMANGAAKSPKILDWDFLRLAGYHDVNGKEKLDARMTDIVENILGEDPDIICLQEVTADSVQKLHEKLKDKYQFEQLHYHRKTGGRQFGNMILVKRDRKIRVRGQNVICFNLGGEERKHAAVALTLQSGHRVNVFCSHMLFQQTTEIEEVQKSIEALEGKPGTNPFNHCDVSVIAGDFNRDPGDYQVSPSSVRDGQIRSFVNAEYTEDKTRDKCIKMRKYFPAQPGVGEKIDDEANIYDHIFVKGEAGTRVSAKIANKIALNGQHRNASDHPYVVNEIKISPSGAK